MPVGRFIFSMRWEMMNSALMTMASVTAICNATSIGPVFDRMSEEIIGRNPMPVSYCVFSWVAGGIWQTRHAG